MSIKKLEKLIQKKPPFPKSINNNNPEFKEYKMETGVCFAWNLLWIPKVSVTKWFSSKGTKFSRHTHREQETIIIYEGIMEITYNTNGSKTLMKGDSCFNLPDEPHSSYFPEDTKYITIMVPGCKDYPGAY